MVHKRLAAGRLLHTAAAGVQLTLSEEVVLLTVAQHMRVLLSTADDALSLLSSCFVVAQGYTFAASACEGRPWWVALPASTD